MSFSRSFHGPGVEIRKSAMSKADEPKSLGGVAPFGYRWKDGKLEIDKAEAPVRKLIFELFLKHRRKKTVAKILNDLGYRTRSASLFSDTTIDRLLRDTTAKGTREVNGNLVSVEAIISSDLWDKVKNVLGNTSQPRQAVHAFLGIVFCNCGGRMVVPSNSAKYVCIDCRRKMLTDDLEAIFCSQLKNLPEPENDDLYKNWKYFSQKDKRILVEQICKRIVIDRDAIEIEFCYMARSQAASVDQHQDKAADKPGEFPVQPPKDASISEPLLSETEAARFLGISKMTLLRRRYAGEIGYFKVGHRILYSKEKHLVPFLKECEI
jgi:hypothetical protein